MLGKRYALYPASSRVPPLCLDRLMDCWIAEHKINEEKLHFYFATKRLIAAKDHHQVISSLASPVAAMEVMMFIIKRGTKPKVSAIIPAR